MDAMAAARPHMIATLDTFRDTLDGDTDPVSGPGGAGDEVGKGRLG